LTTIGVGNFISEQDEATTASPTIVRKTDYKIDVDELLDNFRIALQGIDDSVNASSEEQPSPEPKLEEFKQVLGLF
jgi:hypothetical protein